MKRSSILTGPVSQAGLAVVACLLAIPHHAQADGRHSNHGRGGGWGDQNHYQRSGNYHRGYPSRARSTAIISVGAGYGGGFSRYGSQHFSSYPGFGYYAGPSAFSGYRGVGYMGYDGWGGPRYGGPGYTSRYAPRYSSVAYPRQSVLLQTASYNGSVRGYQGNSTSSSVQVALARRGYYNGRMDGAIGPQSRRAIAAFQRDKGWSQTGTIDKRLLKSLNVR